MYDVPTASATGAGAAVPEPTKVGGGLVVLGASSKRAENNTSSETSDDEEMDC